MGKHIASTATSYRFIGGFGLLGLFAAFAVAQTTTGTTIIQNIPHNTLRGTNIWVTTLINSQTGQPVPGAIAIFGSTRVIGLGSAAPAMSSPNTIMPPQPIQNGFLNPFTGLSTPATLFSTVTTSTNGSSSGGGGSGTSGGNGISGGLGSSSSSSSGAGALGGGGGGGISGGTAGGNFTILPTISGIPNGNLGGSSGSVSGGGGAAGISGGVGGAGGIAGGAGGGGGITGGGGGITGGGGGITGGGGGITGGGGGGITGGGIAGGGGKGAFCGNYGI